MPNVLVVVAPGAEEIETLAVADVLVRGGCEVVLASSAPSPVRGSRGLPLAATTTLEAVAGRDFDCVYLPGGMGSAQTCRDDPRIQDLIARQLAGPRILAIICASPIALLPRGLAKGRTLTCYPDLKDQFAGLATWRDEAVVIDRNLVTSQGPGTAIALGLALVSLLVSRTKAEEVAKGMLVKDGSWRR